VESQNLFMMLPGMQPDELHVLQSLSREMTPRQQEMFISMYRGRRKEEQTMLIVTLVGFLGIAGIQRFMVGEVVMGIVYLLTAGFCGIGTIIDIINIRKITSQYNQQQAIETAQMVKMMNA
jgi:TM2 domain-containing membrane protein YozV